MHFQFLPTLLGPFQLDTSSNAFSDLANSQNSRKTLSIPPILCADFRWAVWWFMFLFCLPCWSWSVSISTYCLCVLSRAPCLQWVSITCLLNRFPFVSFWGKGPPGGSCLEGPGGMPYGSLCVGRLLLLWKRLEAGPHALLLCAEVPLGQPPEARPRPSHRSTGNRGAVRTGVYSPPAPWTAPSFPSGAEPTAALLHWPRGREQVGHGQQTCSIKVKVSQSRELLT